MLPTSMTVTTLLSDGQTVVTQFGSLIALVAAMAVGVWVVRFLIGKLKKAGR